MRHTAFSFCSILGSDSSNGNIEQILPIFGWENCGEKQFYKFRIHMVSLLFIWSFQYEQKLILCFPRYWALGGLSSISRFDCYVKPHSLQTKRRIIEKQNNTAFSSEIGQIFQFTKWAVNSCIYFTSIFSCFWYFINIFFFASSHWQCRWSSLHIRKTAIKYNQHRRFAQQQKVTKWNEIWCKCIRTAYSTLNRWEVYS